MLGDLVFLGTTVAAPVLFAIAFAWCRRRRLEHPHRRGRGLLFAGNLLVLAMLGSLCFLGAECYYRFWYDSTDSFGLTRTTSRWFKRYYAFNHMGFRDNVEYTHPRPPSQRRVSFLGDSFTAGHGVKNVDDRFVNVLRKRHREWDVEALAANGFDTGAEIKLMNELIDDGHDLDQVVLVVCLNDISDIVPEWQETLHRVYRYAQDPGFLITHSYCINTLYYRLIAALEPDVKNYYGSVRAAYDGPIWEQQCQRIVRLRDLCHTNGANFVAVLFPFLHEVGGNYSYRPVHAQLASLFQSARIPFLDLLSLYEHHAGEDLVVSRYDAHPNEAAHHMAAVAIDAFLASAMTSDTSGAASESYRNAVQLTKVGKIDAAILCLEDTLRAFPDHADAHGLLGALAMQSGHLDVAFEHLRAAAALRPSGAIEQNNLGLAWARRGDAEAALNAYREALRLDPDLADAHHNAALLLEQQGEIGAADEHYRDALRLEAANAEAQADFGHLLAATGHHAEAREHLRESLRLRPDSSTAATRLAWLLATCPDAALRDAPAAIQWAEHAVRLTERQEAAPLDALAAALAEAGRFEEAATTAEQALAVARAARVGALAADIEKRLQGYRNQRRAREP